MPGAATRHRESQATQLEAITLRIAKEQEDEANRVLSRDRGVEEDIQMRAETARAEEEQLEKVLEEATRDLERSQRRRERQATRYAIARRGLKTEIAILDARIDFLRDMSREARDRLNGFDQEFGYMSGQVAEGVVSDGGDEEAASQVV